MNLTKNLKLKIKNSLDHIIIDARLYGPKHTGIGRYTKNLLLALTQLPNFSKYKFTLIIHQDSINEVKNDFGDKFNYHVVTFRHYSFAEQLLLPLILYRLRPNLVHFTHFTKPLLYFGQSIVTIHDLIKNFYHGKDVTSRPGLIYWLKHLAYRFHIFITIKFNQIIVPSHFWRNYLIAHYHLPQSKVTTTHEAVDPSFLTNHYPLNTKYLPYILYTGNLYPHKNITVILQALTKIPDLSLKIICARSDTFKHRLLRQVANLHLDHRVEFLGYLPDSKFAQVYSQALCLVHPSLLEGFSLTGLEAMALNCPVISSDSSCLPEIYGDSVLYFDPHNPNQLISQITKLQSSPNLRQKLITLGHQQVAKYSWSHCAQQTFEVYQKQL